MTDKVETTGKGAVSASVAKAEEARASTAASIEAEKDGTTLAEKVAASGLFMHEDQVNGHNWVGAAGEPCNTEHRCRHTPLLESEPRAGLEVRTSGGVFAIPSDFQRGLGAQGWLAVTDGGGKSLFA